MINEENKILTTANGEKYLSIATSISASKEGVHKMMAIVACFPADLIEKEIYFFLCDASNYDTDQGDEVIANTVKNGIKLDREALYCMQNLFGGMGGFLDSLSDHLKDLLSKLKN